MAEITYRGKNYRKHRTIGKVKADHSTPQAFVDWVTSQGDASGENRYLGEIERDIWKNADAQLRISQSHIALVGASPDSSILYVDDANYSGGTVTLAYNTEIKTEDLVLADFRIVNNLAGGTGTGGAPEPALAIGKEDVFPSILTLDDVLLWRLIVDGNHDAIQFFGANEDFTGIPGLIVAAFCFFYSCHDCFTVKGDYRIESFCNRIMCNSAGLLPFLSSPTNWKTTGFHHNVSSGNVAGSVRNPNAYLKSKGDRIMISATANQQAGGVQAQKQAKTAGILNYAVGSMRPPIKQRYEDLTIDLVHDCEVLADRVSDYMVAGFALDGTLGGGSMAVAEDEIILERFTMDIAQKSTDADAPDNAAGIWIRNNAGVSTHVKAADGRINCANDNGAEYSILADGSGVVVEKSNLRSDVATSVLNSAQITSSPLVADNP